MTAGPPIAAAESTVGDTVAVIVVFLVLIAGVVQGIYAYTGRWRGWHYNNSYLHGIAPPLTVFWASVTVLILWTGINSGLFDGPLEILLLLLALPTGLLTLVSLFWLPRFARPRWIAEEEERLKAKRRRPDADGGV